MTSYESILAALDNLERVRFKQQLTADAVAIIETCLAVLRDLPDNPDATGLLELLGEAPHLQPVGDVRSKGSVVSGKVSPRSALEPARLRDGCGLVPCVFLMVCICSVG